MMNEVRTACSHILGTSIESFHSLSGGDINEAYLVRTAKGAFFVKTNTASFASDMLQKEAKGLNLLAEVNCIRTPKVIASDTFNGTAFLLLEFITADKAKPLFWERFGQQLALLHQQTSDHFGLDHNNYIGNLVQKNGSHDDWLHFFIKERLQVQIDLAKKNNRIPHSIEDAFHQLYKKLPSICPIEPASLIHGDLWNGNFICTSEDRVVLIDPALSYAHREMDLAMTLLFGGFDSSFYDAYHETFPLEKGFSDRVEIYQLYYLMVHVNIFGRAYLNQVNSILKKFV